MKLLSYMALAATLSMSVQSIALADTTQLCYPKYKGEGKICTNVYYDSSQFPFNLVDSDDIERGFSNLTKYGVELSQYADNPFLKKIAEKGLEAVANAGFGPILALGRLALGNLGGDKPDPIAEAVKVILARIDEAEQRIINRIDEQFRQDAIDQFNGLSILYQIYNTADTLEKRATSGYLARLYTVDTSLDTLIEYFENSRFQGHHVQNYQAYLDVVALRLLVLAEVERIALYELYGEDIELHHSEYEGDLRQQYQIVLDGVFDYINNDLAKHDDWRVQSDKRFGGISLGQLKSVNASLSGRYGITLPTYSQYIRPYLYPKERTYFDGYDSMSGSRNTTITWKRGDYMSFQTVNYTFLEAPHQLHLTRRSKRGSSPYDFFVGNTFNVEKFVHRENCTEGRYNINGCSNLWRPSTQGFVTQEINYHKERAYVQFLDIYYQPTQQILDTWWSSYHAEGDIRPRNDLDLIVDEIP